MTSLTKTAAFAIAFGVAGLGVAEAASVAKPTAHPIVLAAKPAIHAPAAKAATTFGTGIWKTVQWTTRNPLTGVWSSDVQYLSFAKNGTYVDEIISQGGNGQTGAGGIIYITGDFKLVNSTSMDISEKSETVCVLYCETSVIDASYVDHFTQESPTVVDGSGGLTWTEISTQ